MQYKDVPPYTATGLFSNSTSGGCVIGESLTPPKVLTKRLMKHWLPKAN